VIVQFRSNLVAYIVSVHITGDEAIDCKCSKSKVKVQGHMVKGQGHSLTYQQENAISKCLKLSVASIRH